MSIFYPLKRGVDALVFGLFNLKPGSHAGDAVNFFIFDSVKILILMSVIIFVVSMLRSFLPPEKVRKQIAKHHPLVGHIMASCFGIITPFCSCSAVPLFMGFLEAGVPMGVTFSFLVASPMINEVALVLLLGMFGWKIALLYIASGLVIAIVSGIIIGFLKPEKVLTEFVLRRRRVSATSDSDFGSWKERLIFAFSYVLEILKKVWIYVLVGVGIGAWIHGYVPADFLAQYAGKDKWYAVPLAVLLGIPLYSNAAGVIPLVGVLTEKGVAMGTALAFMMAVTGLSLPEFMILKRVMKIRMILIFAAVVGTGIVITGYLFNFIL